MAAADRVAITTFITITKIIVIIRLSIDVDLRLEVAERGMYVGGDERAAFGRRDTFQILARDSQCDDEIFIVAGHLKGGTK